MKRHFRVWRGDSSGGSLEDFDVEVNDGEVVLDIIHRLQATQAPDLACRWNCKAGKCGSCSMEINGMPRLGCMTRMSTFTADETITVTPLRTFPVIRDLVTDVSFNYQKARETPAFAPPAGVAPGQYRMQQIDVERSQEFRKCIECYLCQNTCHVVRDHEENKEAFSGPRFFIRAAELDMHPLDDRTDRKQYAQQSQGLGFCNITKCCTEVCPEHIKITDNAIIPMKERVVDRRYDPLVRLGRKIFRRDQLESAQPESMAPSTSEGVSGVGSGMTYTSARLPEGPPVGPDGRLDIAELAAPLQGGLSPYGEDMDFPLPPERVAYHHPEADPSVPPAGEVPDRR
ncbi:succinate dehydrogenase/fumarate reductase iron-sulfur subunit [Actinoplanes oblitus]|uniref:Succinate dehydrogenase/fumarate reductase iron-sulfur subunit n=1 Tax=Actinoplanes oblitus TaxID=3040509 RepID=A0ABY8WJC8_9ACTN|nr:succinate dehydrogenase/fumarate reductase iron-sulfur subunit [Actinoplanes oblitus]WIM95850.1 succinate dehydrogenase/fumarate reductase iron-sulfur subunit [Actinoplanes oblitus]